MRRLGRSAGGARRGAEVIRRLWKWRRWRRGMKGLRCSVRDGSKMRTLDATVHGGLSCGEAAKEMVRALKLMRAADMPRVG
eukprot:2838812-Pleurochrysis_carterae.AAC.1